MSGATSFDCCATPLTKGVTLLEASAGTGKTYALARVFLRLVAEEGVEVGKILTVTFTSTATEELRDRIRSLLVEALQILREKEEEGEDPAIRRLRTLKEVPVEECMSRIKLAITCFDESTISTIHGFCNHVLTENSFETQSLFDAELDKEADKLSTEAVQEYWRERFASAEPFVSAAASTKKIKPEAMAKFFNKLPSTQEYELGFAQPVGFETAQSVLVEGFDSLKNAWALGCAEYGDYVASCLGKRAKAKTQLGKHSKVLDRMLAEGGDVSAAGIEILEVMQACELKALKEHQALEKPLFAREAESFWAALESFARAVRVDCVSYLKEKVARWKRDRGLLSFDDLLSLTAKAVTGKDRAGESLRKGLRDSFEAALIDEFQDTDPVQFEIFRELFGNTKEHWLYLIGDPKQSIYRFRGADLEAYFDFSAKTEAAKYSLDTNYRTVTSLVQAVNSFFSNADNPFLHEHLPFSPVEPNEGGSADVEKIYLEKESAPAALVVRELEWNGPEELKVPLARQAIRVDMANEIHRILEVGKLGGKPVCSKDIAVLVRSNHEAKEVWKYFRKRGLPTVVFTDLSLFDSDEAKEALWVLEGVVGCRNDKAVKRALATGLLGMTSEDFQEWQDHPEKWDEWIACFRGCHETWLKEGVYVALRELFARTGAICSNLKRPDGERRVTNFLHLAEVLHQASAGNPLSPSSVVVWLRSKMEGRNSSGEEYQLRLESESESIRILTVHKSKGLEYPIVFLPSFSLPGKAKGGEFSYHREDGKLVVDLTQTAGEEAKEKGMLEDAQEDSRVLYVGLTRAASRCYLYHAPVKLSENTIAPAQVRMMRSWAKGESGKEGETIHAGGNEMGSILIPWLSANQLDDQIELQAFVPRREGIERAVEGIGMEHPPANDFSSAKWNDDRKIPRGGIVSSFSGLTRQVDFEGRDYDGLPADGAADEAWTEVEENIPVFDFPAGAHAGTFMHDVFEHLEFDAPSSWRNFIARKLRDHQFDSDRWTSTIVSMVGQVMECELEPGLVLASLARKDRMEEMEFHFPIQPGFLPDLISALPTGCLLESYLRGVGGSERHRIETAGYLKGLVDLIFRVDGKHYVLDWKSNKLNGRLDGFGQKELEREMLDHHYVLQYHLYVVATHRFLSKRLPNYSYGRDFGGVYYLFTRGMQVGSKSGIFHDLPELSIIEALDQFLTEPQV